MGDNWERSLEESVFSLGGELAAAAGPHFLSNRNIFIYFILFLQRFFSSIGCDWVTPTRGEGGLPPPWTLPIPPPTVKPFCTSCCLCPGQNLLLLLHFLLLLLLLLLPPLLLTTHPIPPHRPQEAGAEVRMQPSTAAASLRRRAVSVETNRQER